MEQKDVFISYSRLDTRIADAVTEYLQEKGISCFVDRTCIPAGGDYINYLENAIITCPVFLFIASRSSYKSQWSWSELKYAIQGNGVKNIIILIIDDVVMPHHIRRELSDAIIIDYKNDKEIEFDVLLKYTLQILKKSRYTNDKKNASSHLLLNPAEAKIFISHSNLDLGIADDVYRILKGNGYDCWMDKYDIQPGIPYAKAITEAILNCSTFILIYSKNILDSIDILNEIDQAHYSKKRIIPFLVDNNNMTPELRYYLSRRQWIVAYPHPQDHYHELIEALSMDCDEYLQPQEVNTNSLGLPPKSPQKNTKRKRLFLTLMAIANFILLLAILFYFLFIRLF